MKSKLPYITGNLLWLGEQTEVPDWLKGTQLDAGWKITAAGLCTVPSCEDEDSPLDPALAQQLVHADVVLLDLRGWPDTTERSGLELCRALRQRLLVLGVPVIALLPSDLPALRLGALESGAADCLTPGTPDRECVARVATHLRLGAQERTLRQRAGELAKQTQQLEQRVMERSLAATRGRDAVIFGLAKLAESRDDNTGHHLERVCAYTGAIAMELALGRDGLSAEWVAVVEQTAALHDIGKVGVSDAILRKSGPLTDEERTAMQRHTVIGGDTLNAIRGKWGDNAFIVTAMQIALGHHEKWNGTGYPFGLAGENIPLPARVVAAADVYDALSSERPYKAAMDHGQVMALMKRDRGKHFDPEVLDAMLRAEERIVAIRQAMHDGAAVPAWNPTVLIPGLPARVEAM